MVGLDIPEDNRPAANLTTFSTHVALDAVSYQVLETSSTAVPCNPRHDVSGWRGFLRLLLPFKSDGLYGGQNVTQVTGPKRNSGDGGWRKQQLFRGRM